jgi:hypothetical protein
MFIQPVSVFVINAYFLGLNIVALRVVVERKIPMFPPSIDVQITSGDRGLINCARTVDGRRKVWPSVHSQNVHTRCHVAPKLNEQIIMSYYNLWLR